MTSIVMMKKEFKEQWRTSRTLIALIAFLLLGLQGPVLAKILPDLIKNSTGNLSGLQITLPQQKAVDAIIMYFSQMNFLPVVVLILIGMGTLAGERERGTQVFVLTKPVTRTQFILSKYFSFLTLVTGAMILTTLAVGYYTILLFDSSFNLAAYGLLNLTLLSFMAFLLAVVILCSSLFKNVVAAGGVAFLAYMVISSAVKFLPDWPKYTPMVVFDTVVPRSMLEGNTSPTELILPFLVGLALAAITMAIACYTYEQREM